MPAVTVQLGQCGNQLGVAFHDVLWRELQEAGYSTESKGVFFRESRGAITHGQPNITARSVLIDMEPKVIQAAYQHVQSTAPGWSFPAKGSFCQQSGSGNNWAQGHHTYGPRVKDACLDIVRREAEGCDFLDGFLLLQSMAGGTGAGLGTFMAELLADHFPAAHLVNACIWPYAAGEVSVQPYNTLLTLSHLVEVSDAVLLFQNEVLHATCTKTLGKKNPGFQDLNQVAAKALAAALLPSYRRSPEGTPSTAAAAAGSRGGSGGGINTASPTSSSTSASRRGSSSSSNTGDTPLNGSIAGKLALHPLADLACHLCSHPRYKVVSARGIPQVAPASRDFTTFSWPTTCRRLRQMALTGSFSEEGLEWGPASNAAGLGLAPHRYKNKAASSMLVLRGQGALDVAVPEFQDPGFYASWAVDPLLVAGHSSSFDNCQVSATLLATDQASIKPVGPMLQRALLMMGAGAYIHQYEACGLSKEDVTQALAAVEDVRAFYAEMS